MRNKGQSMFEVVLALFLISLIIIAVVIVSTNSITNSVFSRNKTQASRFTQEAIEWVRSQREVNYSNFLTIASTPTYCLDSLNFSNVGTCGSSEYISGTIFLRQALFSVSSASSKTIVAVTITTYWYDSKGYHEARSTTNFTDIREED